MSEATTKPEQNKMGTMPIKPLLLTMSLPMILSMLVQAMYNIIDSIFVAKLEERALTAVSMAFPIQNLLIAVSAGTCVGVNALLSRSLGAGNREDAQKANTQRYFSCHFRRCLFWTFWHLWFPAVFCQPDGRCHNY